MKKLLIILVLGMFATTTLVNDAYAKGGGGRAGGGARSSGSRSVSPSKPSVSKPSTSKPSTPSTPKVGSRPSASTKTVNSATAKTVNGKNYGTKGSVVDSNYQPKFRGYSAPAGSVVYYRSYGFMDWLPFYLIMTSQSHREAVVVEPAKDGQPAKETVVKEEGVDGMYVWNWIFSILFVIGLIALIVWFVNRRSNKYAY